MNPEFCKNKAFFFWSISLLQTVSEAEQIPFAFYQSGLAAVVLFIQMFLHACHAVQSNDDDDDVQF